MLVLVPTLIEAQPAAPCPQSGPLSEAQLTELLKGSVAAPRIRQLVASCGVNFEPTGEAISRLRAAGMPQTVLAAVRAAIGPAERKRRVEQALWESIKDSQAPAVFEGYLRQYPEGQFAVTAQQKYRDLKVASVRAGMERTLAAGQWDAAEGKIRDLLRVVPEDSEIMGWQRQIAEGREKLRLEKEAAARAVVPPTTIATGAKKVNPKDGLTYVWIPPGTFMMGCSPGDAECDGGEKPAHQVTITKGFWLGQTPVTQQAYQRVTGQNPSYFKGDSLPVEQVDWNGAKAYCVAIGGRLPTEAEWEYAARAGSTGARYGNLDEIAWYSGNSGGQTHEVGRKSANTLGLFDMLGNVWQWVADWYGNYQSGAQRDPSGPPPGQYRAMRGGSFGFDSKVPRVSGRVRGGPGIHVNTIGFRCVGEPSSPSPTAPASSVPDRPVASASIPAAASPTPAIAPPATAPPTATRLPAIAPPATAPPATVVAGTTQVNPRDRLTYAWIPPGTFMMGCSPGDNDCDDDEKPAHRVTITKGFWLGQTPVTQQGYQRVIGQNPSNFKGASLPVETVDWNEAEAYCLAIGGRLPTEAEWEYAARAGSTGARYGNVDEIAWHSGNSDSKTHEVGQKLPNAFGLFDMLGNVWQWTADRFGDYPSGAQSDPSGAVSGQGRSLRGRSWGSFSRTVRVSDRVRGGPGGRSNSVGLRCVRE